MPWPPLVDALAAGQPFLLRHLPDNPRAYDTVHDHAPGRFDDFVGELVRRPQLRRPVAMADPIVSPARRARGFAVVQVARQVLTHPWSQHPQASLGPIQPEACRASIGPGREGLFGTIASPSQKDSPAGEQDAVGVLNLVKVGDPFVLKLNCPVRHGASSSLVVVLIRPQPLGAQPVVLTLDDVESVSLRSNPG